MASHTGLILGMAETSCRPWILSDHGPPRSNPRFSAPGKWKGSVSRPPASRISAPVEIPPKIPPASFFSNPPGIRGSLDSEPSIRATRNPAPTSTPRTAPMLIKSLGQIRLQFIEDRLPQSGRASPDKNFHDAPQRIPLQPGLLDLLFHFHGGVPVRAKKSVLFDLGDNPSSPPGFPPVPGYTP